MLHAINSRLAALSGIRQTEALHRANAIASRVDRASARLWADILRHLRPPLTAWDSHRVLVPLFRRLIPTMHETVGTALERLAVWGHKTAAADLAGTLPGVYLADAVMMAMGRGLRHRPRAGAAYQGRDASISIAQIIQSAGLNPRALIARSQEPTAPRPSPATTRALFRQLLFPPPSLARVSQIVYSESPRGEQPWPERIKSLSKLAPPEQLASVVAHGLAAGKSHREVAKDLLPLVDGVRASARRVARTEGVRIAHAVQGDCHAAVEDLTVGFQGHALLDEATRPWHAARNGVIYYRHPGPGQKGYEQMPHPPEEPVDPRERPLNTPATAANCRCWTSVVLRPPSYILNNPKLLSVFSTSTDRSIPDPSTFDGWFEKADERRRRLAVGTRRYSAAQEHLGREPAWVDFVDPNTGGLLTIDQLKTEPAGRRSTRVGEVRRVMAERNALLQQVSRFGFLMPGKEAAISTAGL